MACCLLCLLLLACSLKDGQMKFLVLVADGMGDWSHPALNDRTPLEAAHTPHMDRLAAASLVGTCRTVPEHMPPGSDVANMALFGFDPAVHHTGRGPIEAAAQGLELDPDDLVWRCNLVTLSDPGARGTMRDYSAGHIDSEVSVPLVKDLQAGLGNGEFELIPGIQYRHLLVQKQGATTPAADIAIRPPHDILDQPIGEDVAAYGQYPALASLFNRAAALLGVPSNTSGANAIWPWGQGRPLHLPDFKEAFGLDGAVISAVDLVKGLGRAANMEVIDIPGATGLLDTNYEGKVEAALGFLQHGDFVYLHVEGPDECGHMGDPGMKTEAVARFDDRILRPILEGLDGEEFAVLLTCDHFTPLAKRTHTHDPVPFLLYRSGTKMGKGPQVFTETTAKETGLHLATGHELLPFALEKVGLR